MLFKIWRLRPRGPAKVQGWQRAAVAGLTWDEALEMGPTAQFRLGFGIRAGWRREVPPPLEASVPSSEFASSFRCRSVALQSREPVPGDLTWFSPLAGPSEDHILSRDIKA